MKTNCSRVWIERNRSRLVRGPFHFKSSSVYHICDMKTVPSRLCSTGTSSNSRCDQTSQRHFATDLFSLLPESLEVDGDLTGEPSFFFSFSSDFPSTPSAGRDTQQTGENKR